MVKAIGLLTFATALLALAICCLLFPERVQTIALKAVNWGLPSRVEAVNSYMRMVSKFVQSSQYRACLRVIGTLSLLFSVLLLWMLVTHLTEGSQ